MSQQCFTGMLNQTGLFLLLDLGDHFLHLIFMILEQNYTEKMKDPKDHQDVRNVPEENYGETSVSGPKSTWCKKCA